MVCSVFFSKGLFVVGFVWDFMISVSLVGLFGLIVCFWGVGVVFGGNCVLFVLGFLQGVLGVGIFRCFLLWVCCFRLLLSVCRFGSF